MIHIDFFKMIVGKLPMKFFKILDNVKIIIVALIDTKAP